MRVVITTMPKAFIRANQIGDWDYGPETILASVSHELQNKDSQLAIGVHELIEAWLCRKHGVTDEDVVRFDEMYEAERDQGKHGELDEPGDDPRAPYRQEHMAATHVERAVCAVLELSWSDHCVEIAK